MFQRAQRAQPHTVTVGMRRASCRRGASPLGICLSASRQGSEVWTGSTYCRHDDVEGVQFVLQRAMWC